MTRNEHLAPLYECREHLEKAMAALDPLAYVDEDHRLAQKIRRLWDEVDNRYQYIDSV